MKKHVAFLTVLLLFVVTSQAFAVYEFTPQQKSLGYRIRHHDLKNLYSRNWTEMIPNLHQRKGMDKTMSFLEKLASHKKKNASTAEGDNTSNPNARRSLIFGIAGLLLCILVVFTFFTPGIGSGLAYISFFTGLVCQVGAIISGIRALKRHESRGMAIAGIILGGLPVFVYILSIVVGFIWLLILFIKALSGT